jgi:hypothetical protein
LQEKLASLQGVQINSNANQADYASAAQQFADRMDERARSVQIETEAKTKELLKAKFEKRELEQQAKYQEMVTTMQNQYQQLAETRKAETEAAEEKLKRFENEYILRSEHVREVETALSRCLSEMKDKGALELQVQLKECRSLCLKENEVPLEELRAEIREYKRTIEDLEAGREDMEAEIRKSESIVEKQIERADQEKRARQLLGEHLEEGNMNVSRLAALLRKAEEEKGEMKEKIDSLKSHKKEAEAEKTATLDKIRKMEEDAIEKERNVNEQKLKMKDLEINAENAINGSDAVKNELSNVQRKLEHAQNLLESAEKQKTEAVDREYKAKEEVRVTDSWRCYGAILSSADPTNYEL